MYGTTVQGGVFAVGTVFRMDKTGVLTTLHSFNPSTTGANPWAGLIEGDDGFLYGTTVHPIDGGFITASVGDSQGTVFRIDSAGNVTVLHAFDGATGASPYSRLIQADDGGLYGTTLAGGTFGGGIVFRITLPRAAAVTLVAPNGGERVLAGTPTTIRWTADESPAYFDVELSRDGGGTFSPIAECMELPGPVRRCRWTPDGRHTTFARVRVTAQGTNGASASDLSDSNFTIVTVAPRIRLIKPNAHTTWRIGTTHTIRFVHSLGIGQRIKIDVSRDGGRTWHPITILTTMSAHGGTYRWKVTGLPTRRARIRVRWANGAAVRDVSDRVFVIAVEEQQIADRR